MILGAIGSRHRASVRAGGRVVLHEGTPQELRLDWWIGGDDRWYEPEREITARQSLLRDLPIVSVAIRVPSGDAVTTCFTTVQGPRELVVTELANKSKVPFATALVLSGPGARDVTLEGTAVRVGGLPVLHLPRTAQRVACASTIESLRALVQSGGAEESYAPIVGESASAFIFPLTHTMSIRAAAIVGASSPAAFAAAPVVNALPAVHDLANGWDVHMGRGIVSTSLPSTVGQPALRALMSSLLLAAEPAAADRDTPIVVAAALARALNLSGFHAEAGALIEDVPDRQTLRGALSDTDSVSLVGTDIAATATVVDALAHHAALTHDAVFAQTMSPAVAGALEFLVKRAKKEPLAASWLPCARLVPTLFRVARDPRAAQQVEKLLANNLSGSLPELPMPVVPAVSAGASFVPEEPLRLSEALRTRVSAVVQPGGRVAGGEKGSKTLSSNAVSILAGIKSTDLGQSIEVRNAPTPYGRLSFALRWHGDRPAVLWECATTHDDQDAGSLTLHAPTFANWSETGARGEALLPAPTI